MRQSAVETQRRRPGRPPKASRNAEEPEAGVAAARTASARTPVVRGHTAEGRVIALGRDGKPISRKGTPGVDKFAISPDQIPEGWSYQWIAETVLNAPQTSMIVGFQQNGWTEVPADRHPSIPVRQDGLVLVERPKALTDEARGEEIQAAKDQIRANVEQFMPADSVQAQAGLRATGGIRKGRPQSVVQDGVPAPTLEIADE
jgi:hypothetical protein